MRFTQRETDLLEFYIFLCDRLETTDQIGDVYGFDFSGEVLEKANNTPFGLSAGVWTDKGSKIFNMTTKLKAGVVWANTYNKFDPTSPFGGYKESGFGREGGLHGLAGYVNLV